MPSRRAEEKLNQTILTLSRDGPALRTTLTVWAFFFWATQLVLRQAESLTEYS